MSSSMPVIFYTFSCLCYVSYFYGFCTPYWVVFANELFWVMNEEFLRRRALDSVPTRPISGPDSLGLSTRLAGALIRLDLMSGVMPRLSRWKHKISWVLIPKFYLSNMVSLKLWMNELISTISLVLRVLMICGYTDSFRCKLGVAGGESQLS